jgi:hypothetical protein
MQLLKTLYRLRKQIFPCLIMFAALFLVSGFPALIALFQNHGAQTVGNPKLVMLTGPAFFLYFLGVLGLYFWTRTDYQHYRILFWVGTGFIFASTLGVQWLWNFGNS